MSLIGRIYAYEVTAGDGVRLYVDITREGIEAGRRELSALRVGDPISIAPASAGSYFSSFESSMRADPWGVVSVFTGGTPARRQIVVPARPFIVAWLNGGCAVCTDNRGVNGVACLDCWFALDGAAQNAFSASCLKAGEGVSGGALDFGDEAASHVDAFLAGGCAVCAAVDRGEWSYAHAECWNALPLADALKRRGECEAAKAAPKTVAAPKVALDL